MMDMHNIPGFRLIVDPRSKDSSTHFPLDGEDFHKVSDEVIIAPLDTAPIIHHFGGTKVVRLSQTLALKGGFAMYPCEVHAMILARKHTQIPLPTVHRVIAGEPDDGYYGARCYIVMDYIDGQGLDVCWERLDAEKRLDDTSQVAEMIKEMADVALTVPGPIGGARRCWGPWFSNYGAAGFQTIGEMEEWFNYKLDVCNQYKQSVPNTPRFKFENLLLTHQDMAPRNMILDGLGKVWLIGWAFAGAYPPGFERAALLKQCNRYFVEFGEEVGERITPYPDVELQLYSITYGLTTAAPVDFRGLLGIP